MPRLILFNGITHEFHDDATDEVIAKTLKDKQSVDEAVSGQKYIPPQQSLMEKLMNWWQEGAGAPQPQAYDPRRYPRHGFIK